MLAAMNEDRTPEGVEADDAREGAMGPMDFSTFILSLGSSVMVNLGLVTDPDGKKYEPNCAAAKQVIDILGLLEEKTRGNLTEAEDRLLKSLLYDVRVHFCDAQNKGTSSKPTETK
jgi:hypothetical protein